MSIGPETPACNLPWCLEKRGTGDSTGIPSSTPPHRRGKGSKSQPNTSQLHVMAMMAAAVEASLAARATSCCMSVVIAAILKACQNCPACLLLKGRSASASIFPWSECLKHCAGKILSLLSGTFPRSPYKIFVSCPMLLDAIQDVTIMLLDGLMRQDSTTRQNPNVFPGPSAFGSKGCHGFANANQRQERTHTPCAWSRTPAVHKAKNSNNQAGLRFGFSFQPSSCRIRSQFLRDLETLNPKPSTLNPKPFILNPINPTPLNPKPYAA